MASIHLDSLSMEQKKQIFVAQLRRRTDGAVVSRNRGWTLMQGERQIRLWVTSLFPVTQHKKVQVILEIIVGSSEY